MLGVTAYDVSARMKYKGLSLDVAARETIEHLTSIHGEGGVIAVDARGNVQETSWPRKPLRKART